MVANNKYDIKKLKNKAEPLTHVAVAQQIISRNSLFFNKYAI